MGKWRFNPLEQKAGPIVFQSGDTEEAWMILKNESQMFLIPQIQLPVKMYVNHDIYIDHSSWVTNAPSKFNFFIVQHWAKGSAGQ